MVAPTVVSPTVLPVKAKVLHAFWFTSALVLIVSVSAATAVVIFEPPAMVSVSVVVSATVDPESLVIVSQRF